MLCFWPVRKGCGTMMIGPFGQEERESRIQARDSPERIQRKGLPARGITSENVMTNRGIGHRCTKAGIRKPAFKGVKPDHDGLKGRIISAAHVFNTQPENGSRAQ